MDDSSDYIRRLRLSEKLSDATDRFRRASERALGAFDENDKKTLEEMLGVLEGIRDELVKLAGAADNRATDAERSQEHMLLWAVVGGLAGVVGATAAIVAIVLALT